jgi:hypothetical protein
VRLDEAREKLGAVLAPIESDDPTVLTNLVDSIEPPALMIGWDNPWMEPDTSCLSVARIAITAVSGRMHPGAGIESLERLVTYTLQRLRDGGPQQWPLISVGGPRVFTIAKTNYLAARISVRVRVT